MLKKNSPLKVTYIIRLIFTVVVVVVDIAGCQYYSNRTKCWQNTLSFDSQTSLFYQNTQFSGVNYTEIINVMGMIQNLYQYSKGVNQIALPNHRCQKYFQGGTICCRYSDLDAFTNQMVSLYNRTYLLAYHPVVDYVYKIYDLYKAGKALCLGNYEFKVPGRNGYAYNNATAPLGELFKNIANEMNKIKSFELDFIVNSACTLCLGVEDFKTFLFPTHQNITISNRLIYNQDYFTNATSFIAQRMWNSKQYVDQIHNFISGQLALKLNNSDNSCAGLSALINNSNEINKRKICLNSDQCLKFAQKYIGGPAAPGYSKMFTSISQNRGITKTMFRIITSNSAGFKGNQTYIPYISNSPPTIFIKGNNYTYA